MHIYSTTCTACEGIGTARYTIWSDVYGCPDCGAEVPLWKHGIDRKRGTVKRKLTCPACQHTWQKTAAARVRVEPAWVKYVCQCRRGLQERDFTEAERREYVEFAAPIGNLFYPQVEVERDREMYKRSALHLQGIRSVADFYTPRNLYALALLWDAIQGVSDERVRLGLAFAFTNTAWHGTRMRRFNTRGGHRPLTGTLYVPQLSSEANVFDVFDHKVSHLARFYAELDADAETAPGADLHMGSATDLGWLEDASVDYIFTDPPFGSNIFYADCNPDRGGVARYGY